MPGLERREVDRMESARDVKGLTRALRRRKSNEPTKQVLARSAAAAALGRIGDPRAVKDLLSALGDDTPLIQEAAARALGQMGDARAVGALIAALAHRQQIVRDAAADGLKGIGGPQVIDQLIAVVQRGSTDARCAAAQVLGTLRDRRAVDVLIRSLGDGPRSVRSKAAKALGEIGDPRSIQPLSLLLRDEDVFIRDGAAAGLGAIGDPAAADVLIVALQDGEWSFRAVAAGALARIREAHGELGGVTKAEMDQALSQLGDECRKGVEAEQVIESADRAGYSAAEGIVARAKAANHEVFRIRALLREKGGTALMNEVIALAYASLRVAEFEYLQDRWGEASA
jgi:HEAT repeat protein